MTSGQAPVLAVDVGGTTIKGELVGPDGSVLAHERRPTPTGGGAALEVVAELGRTLLDKALDQALDGAAHEPRRASAGPAAVSAGVVVPGLVDADRGIAVYSANIGWRDQPFAEPLAERWGIPVRLGHDCASAAVAELRAGAARGLTHVAVVVIGTGIAAVQVAAGRLVTGPRGEVSEIGHVRVRSGTRCPCGGEGCLETVASAAAVARRYADRTGLPVAGAADVLARLDDDPVAREVWTDAVEALADALAALCTLTSPQAVVLGGGLGAAGDALAVPLRAALGTRVRVVRPPEVLAAALGERGGLAGAALLARDGWPER